MTIADPDPTETREWIEAIGSVLEYEGPERAHFLLDRAIDTARRSGADVHRHRRRNAPGKYGRPQLQEAAVG